MHFRCVLAGLALAGCGHQAAAPIDADTSGAEAGVDASCATFTAEAKVAPAALLFVVDRTASMAQVGKWDAARDAIVTAIGDEAFDDVSLGLLSFPEPVSVAGPACIFQTPIYCSVALEPQVAVQPATAARSAIQTYLTATQPETNDLADSSPIYAALNGAYAQLRTVPDVDKRAVVLITDGGGSCTSIASPARPAYVDGNGCSDWEEPPTMAALVDEARTDATAPTETFVIGVPGSDSTGQQVGGYDTPPYSMRLALSTYAVAGSPSTVDPACDASTPYSQTGADPAHPCHIDLSNGQAFSSTSLADAIQTIRGNALACTYALPELPAGQVLDRDQVNVQLTLNGVTSTLPRRGSPTDACTSAPCWDYDANGQVELIGAACSSVTHAPEAKLDIYVGCATIIL